MKSALVAGDFTGSVDCRHDRLSIKYIGQVRTVAGTFAVYSYRYKLAPACKECAVHGGQRIIFMKRGRYVGQYKSDFVSVAIRDGDLILTPIDPNSGGPVTVKFTRTGPPKQLFVDSELIGFSR